MDELTAIAFAAEALERAHPNLPKDFRRYVSPAMLGRDANRHYIVSFGWQRKTSKTGAERFFEVLVNPWNARTTVLLDTNLDDFRPEDFELYE